jgi:rfaE bifunctional protein kinase chain/domain
LQKSRRESAIFTMLKQTVKRFSAVRAVVVGDLVADQYIYGQTERISREAPVLIVRHEREEVQLGGAANVAANVAALGAKVTVVGGVGRDAPGEALKGLFLKAGIRLRQVVAPTTETKTRVLAGGLSTTRQQMIRIDRGAVEPLPEKVRRSLGAQVRAALKTCDVAIVSDYGAGVICDETRHELLKFARSGLLCVDSRFALRSLKGATLCKPNEPELQALTQLPVGSDAEFVRAAKRALSILDCETLLVTRGRKGMALFQKSGAPLELPVYGPPEAVDVTGAGDTVIAAYAVAIGAGASAGDAARLANVAGGLKVQKLGTATVSRSELLSALDHA